MKKHIIISVAILLICAVILGFMKFGGYRMLDGYRTLEIDDFDIDYTSSADRFSSFGFPSSVDYPFQRIYDNKFSICYARIERLVIRTDLEKCSLYFVNAATAEHVFWRLCRNSIIEIGDSSATGEWYYCTIDDCFISWWSDTDFITIHSD